MSFKPEYLLPFKNIQDLTRAIFIINKTYCETVKNIETVTNCVNSINKSQLSQEEIRRFIEKIKFCPNEYPTDVLKNIDELEKDILLQLKRNKLPMKVLRTSVTECRTCQAKSTQNKLWYDLHQNKRETMTYLHNGIGKKAFIFIEMANLPCSYKRQKGKNGKLALLL